jgi:hypothetical protein
VKVRFCSLVPRPSEFEIGDRKISVDLSIFNSTQNFRSQIEIPKTGSGYETRDFV